MHILKPIFMLFIITIITIVFMNCTSDLTPVSMEETDSPTNDDITLADVIEIRDSISNLEFLLSQEDNTGNRVLIKQLIDDKQLRLEEAAKNLQSTIQNNLEAAEVRMENLNRDGASNSELTDAQLEIDTLTLELLNTKTQLSEILDSENEPEPIVEEHIFEISMEDIIVLTDSITLVKEMLKNSTESDYNTAYLQRLEEIQSQLAILTAQYTAQYDSLVYTAEAEFNTLVAQGASPTKIDEARNIFIAAVEARDTAFTFSVQVLGEYGASYLSSEDITTLSSSSTTQSSTTVDSLSSDSILPKVGIASSSDESSEAVSSSITPSSSTPLSSSSVLSSSSTPYVNNPPIYLGNATISGALMVSQSLTANAGSSCTDPLDVSPEPTLSVIWYSNDASGTFTGSNEIGTGDEYTLLDANEDSYIYAVVTCTDNEGLSVSDTTNFTDQIGPEVITKNLTVSAQVGGTVSQSGLNSIPINIPFLISATALTGYEFTGWSITTGSVTISNISTATTAATLITEDAEITAQFVAIDVTPPSIPEYLITSAHHNQGMTMSWALSTDNVGVAGYKVFKNSIEIYDGATPHIVLTNLSKDRFTVVAYDAKGNQSNHSLPLFHLEAEANDGAYDTNPYYPSGYGYMGDIDDGTGSDPDWFDWQGMHTNSGTYKMRIRKSDWNGEYNTQIQFHVDNSYKNHIDHIGNTGGYENWIVLTDTDTFTMVNGTSKFTMVLYGYDYNLDWVEILPQY